MRKCVLSAIVCALTIAFLGCLEFDEQTVYVEHDGASDRLILILNYMGLFAADNDRHAGAPSETDLAEAKKQLAEAVEARSVALIGTFPLAISKAAARKGLDDPAEHISQDIRTAVGALLDEITVRNGGFYTDPAGRLCSAQVVTVEHASRAVDLINRAVNLKILEHAQEADEPKEHALVELARKGHEWVKLVGQALEVALPVTEEELAAERPRFFADVFENDERLSRKSLCDVLANPVLVWHDDDLLRLKVGYRSMPSELLVCPVLGDYRPNLEEHVAATYGLHLDDNLARYLLEPDAPADTEEQEAARLMAPRLTQRQRARVLVHALKAEPSDALRARLRQEPLPDGRKEDPAKLSDDALLALWQEWLASRPVPRAKE